MNLIEVKNLKKYFIQKSGLIKKDVKEVKAVDDVSFYIKKGETLGLVGESGCGKSTLGRTLIRLYDVTDGEILFDGEDISRKNEKHLKEFRKRTQTIFQDPYASLNPNMNVMEIICEPLDIHTNYSKSEKKDIVYNLLEKVGLKKEHANRYPHEFSGGQRQRIGIARALSVKPDFIFCDEPISALDVSVQAQVINLLEDLQEELGITYLFIAHDLSMVKHISDRVGVMYLGKIVEIGSSEDIYNNPRHPYTKALLSSIPIIGEKTKSEVLDGDVPSPINPPSGCRFRTRCKYKTLICEQKEPIMIKTDGEHFVACHNID
ncbi:oligopeptide/dipeptide ABC transporter, ATP-binding, C-terminal domain protein [[Clostridium] bifermentans ATCC 638]|uniref:Oligopeptide/dipeptide ABC transporter, ATP-binding, C-terminal domain protein n=1 Tax=Paraclostridium bifermentans ATCC 638 = DSM 14991 TaxID=1233171 RepID=T4VPA2_PARBF|nr:dipeptide ABC transporter ATP-binding protein [Paraclostridium bifermentans]EQK43343.1 oligopeptide/dipeptide ABC transporter, ATP-binding, C-terminal domain protein [[Clostridium] bifermentans ATCC 638] [Paraclostridium bifermentans ATCC 638 = DSM 14991]RIZ60560.1 ABC transporter ATP-binding protein [Paraclostridium bifermentans]UAG17202.1 dipeptide ABC transporter ATP-binding protein [Paraclostridium bifermentans]